MRAALMFTLWQQAVWWSAVVLGDLAAFLSTLVGVVWILHRRMLSGAAWRLVIVTALLGYAVDLGLAALMDVQWRGHAVFPVWLLMIWLSFTAGLPQVFSAVWRHPRMGALLLAALAPFSYLAGARLGSADVGLEASWWLSLMAVWALYPFVWRGVAKKLLVVPLCASS